MDAAPILIVEDEPKLAEILREYLDRAGYATHVLADGREVAAWVREQRPALILLDLMLPGKDGLDVCRELRAFTSVPDQFPFAGCTTMSDGLLMTARCGSW